MRRTLSPTDKRKAFRRALSSGTIIRAPGAFLPLAAIEIERHGFEAIYLSGAVLAADLGLPDIGLTTLSEVADRAEQFARVTNLPIILDCDTGFGEPMNVARCVEIMESRGMAALQIEDQEMPKRCGHLDGKTLVSTEDMVRRIRAAAEARRDPETVIIARTDAFAGEGIEGVIARSNAYVEAGADVIFAEALTGAEDWTAATKGIPAPLLANMTEFGKSDLLSADALQALGASVVIYPVTLLRLAMGITRRSLAEIAATGTQTGLIDQMQTRAELYDLLDYEAFNRFDSSIYNFTIRSEGD
ncbi:MAG: methylisocitrate lyase [Pseudomonadota bacterium]